MVLRSKCIVAPIEEDDGKRISIMSRHTLNDGKTPEERLLVPGVFDEHMPEFAVPIEVIRKYYSTKDNKITFDELAVKYNEYIVTQRDKVIALIQRALVENVTVLCIEPEEEKHICHRSLFMKYVQDTAKEIDVVLQTEIR